MSAHEDNNDLEYKKQAYDAYIKERDTLRTESLELSGRYDQAILALAGGALVLSVTFIEKIAPHPNTNTLIVLLLGWLCLIGSLLCGLFALASSQTSINEEIRKITRAYRVAIGEIRSDAGAGSDAGGSPDQSLEARPSTRDFNEASRWLLVLGLGLLCFFSVLNVPYAGGGDRTMSDKQHGSTESKGSFVLPESVLFPPKPTAPAKDTDRE